jgi:hypothetical protein
MEDVIQTYMLPYAPKYPVVCFDEACKQLFGEVRSPRRPRRGSPAQVDYEYERKGVCHQLLMCDSSSTLPSRIFLHFHELWQRKGGVALGNSACLIQTRT